MPSNEIFYQTLVARRLQSDNLLWQVPVLAITAQAFLFTIALGPDTSTFSRIVASLLAIVVTLLSGTLMRLHRQAELADAERLLHLERQAGIPPLHGPRYKDLRDDQDTRGHRTDIWVPRSGGYVTWIVGLALFGIAAIAIIVVTLTAPTLLTGLPT